MQAHAAAGLVSEVRLTLSEAEEARVLFIEQFDFEPIRDRLVAKLDWTPEAADRAIEETKRYFAVIAILGHGELSISPACDEVWHALILHTRLYREFCDGAFGFFLDHLPSDGTAEDSERLSRYYEDTLSELERCFEGYDEELWPANLQCCKRCTCRAK